MELAPCIVGKGVKLVKRETVGEMFEWLGEEGYGGDVDMCWRLRTDM